jgi:hypothetical protein
MASLGRGNGSNSPSGKPRGLVSSAGEPPIEEHRVNSRSGFRMATRPSMVPGGSGASWRIPVMSYDVDACLTACRWGGSTVDRKIIGNGGAYGCYGRNGEGFAGENGRWNDGL